MANGCNNVGNNRHRLIMVDGEWLTDGLIMFHPTCGENSWLVCVCVFMPQSYGNRSKYNPLVLKRRGSSAPDRLQDLFGRCWMETENWRVGFNLNFQESSRFFVPEIIGSYCKLSSYAA